MVNLLDESVGMESRRPRTKREGSRLNIMRNAALKRAEDELAKSALACTLPASAVRILQQTR